MFLEGCTKRGFQSAESVTGRLAVVRLVDTDMTVACGGFGDVVVATCTVEHDHKNRFTARPRPRFEGAQEAISELGRLASASTSV